MPDFYSHFNQIAVQLCTYKAYFFIRQWHI